MGRTEVLLERYRAHIAIPWKTDIAAPQRVIFCVYPPAEELNLRAKIGEFELATRETGHGWALYDLTDSFAVWLSGLTYRTGYFSQPELLPTVLPRYLDFIEKDFKAFLQEHPPDTQSVMAVMGLGTVFGLLRAREIVERMAPLVAGRLVVFFPGSYENSNYRLLDGYDGWDYHAVPITADRNV